MYYWFRYSCCFNDYLLFFCVSEVYMKNELCYFSSLWENLRCIRKICRWDIFSILKIIYFSVFRFFLVIFIIFFIRYSKCLIVLNGLWYEELKIVFCINRCFYFIGVESRIYCFFVVIWYWFFLELCLVLFWLIYDW